MVQGRTHNVFIRKQECMADSEGDLLGPGQLMRSLWSFSLTTRRFLIPILHDEFTRASIPKELKTPSPTLKN